MSESPPPENRYSISVQGVSSSEDEAVSTPRSSTRSRSESTPAVTPLLIAVDDRERRKSSPNPEIAPEISTAPDDESLITDSSIKDYHIKTPTNSQYSANTRRISSALKHSLNSRNSISRKSVDSRLRFSTTFQVREYTGQHPAENVGSGTDDTESFYEPVNFDLDENGEVKNYKGKLKTGDLVKTGENGKVMKRSENDKAPPGFRTSSQKSILSNSSSRASDAGVSSIISQDNVSSNNQRESKPINNQVIKEPSKRLPGSHTGILKKPSSGIMKSSNEKLVGGKRAQQTSDSILASKGIRNDDKVVVTNIKLSRYHITGVVRSNFFFDEQNCHIWYSIDNWRTFQENSAILTRTINPLGSDENLPQFANQFYYQFDIEIPMPQGCRKSIPGKSLERRTADDNLHSQNSSRSQTVYDDSGRSKYIQFYAVMRNQTYLYLDTDFKVYCLRLKEDDRMEFKGPRELDVAEVTNNESNADSVPAENKPLSVLQQGRKLAHGMRNVMKSIGKMV